MGLRTHPAPTHYGQIRLRHALFRLDRVESWEGSYRYVRVILQFRAEQNLGLVVSTHLRSNLARDITWFWELKPT